MTAIASQAGAYFDQFHYHDALSLVQSKQDLNAPVPVYTWLHEHEVDTIKVPTVVPWLRDLAGGIQSWTLHVSESCDSASSTQSQDSHSMSDTSGRNHRTRSAMPSNVHTPSSCVDGSTALPRTSFAKVP